MGSVDADASRLSPLRQVGCSVIGTLLSQSTVARFVAEMLTLGIIDWINSDSVFLLIMT